MVSISSPRSRRFAAQPALRVNAAALTAPTTNRLAEPHDHWAALATRWDHRAALAGEWLANETAVVDIGCGLMSLRDHLVAGTHYLGVDIVERGPQAVVCDLNAAPLPDLTTHPLLGGERRVAAALLGVIEYLDDVPGLLLRLAQFDRVVLSYNHASLHDLAWRWGLRRNRVNWHNRFGPAEFARLLERAGLALVTCQRLRLGEVLYDLRTR